jgi:hypothetical protein
MAKELTVREMASMGGLARAKARNKAKLQAWRKLGERTALLDSGPLARMVAMLHRWNGQKECGRVYGRSVRTVGRPVA